MFSDGVLPLVRSGVINGSMKSTEAGKLVATFLIGSQVSSCLLCSYRRVLVATRARAERHSLPKPHLFQSTLVPKLLVPNTCVIFVLTFTRIDLVRWYRRTLVPTNTRPGLQSYRHAAAVAVSSAWCVLGVARVAYLLERCPVGPQRYGVAVFKCFHAVRYRKFCTICTSASALFVILTSSIYRPYQ